MMGAQAQTAVHLARDSAAGHRLSPARPARARASGHSEERALRHLFLVQGVDAFSAMGEVRFCPSIAFHRRKYSSWRSWSRSETGMAMLHDEHVAQRRHGDLLLLRDAPRLKLR